MTASLASLATPQDRLDAAIRHALDKRRRSRLEAAPGSRSLPPDQAAAIEHRLIADLKAAAGEYAAALIERHARSPYPPPGRHQQGGGDAA